MAARFLNPKIGSSIFLELAGDEILDGGKRCVCIRAVRTYGDDGAVTGSEHHEAHDAFSIHFLTVFFHENVRLEAICRFDELGGGAGVDAELVEDGEVFFNHE